MNKKRIKKRIVKHRFKKGINKSTNTAVPYFIDTHGRQSASMSLLCVFLRIALLFAACASVSLLMVHIYSFPVGDGVIIRACLISVFGFNLLFILLKYRYAFPLLGLACMFIDFDSAIAGAKHFKDIIFIRLDSRLLYTERFSSISRQYLENPEPDFLSELTLFIVLISCTFCLIVTVSARGRFIGSILIATVIVYIPALGAEIATVTPTFKWAVISMFGLFAVWAGGNYGSENPAASKTRQKRTVNKHSGFIGGISSLNRYIWSGSLAFTVALVSFAFTDILLPRDEVPDLVEIFSDISIKIQESFGELGNKISDGLVGFSDDIVFSFSELDDSGYFHQNTISSVSNSVDSLPVTKPSDGLNPVLKVTFEDISQPLYLRNGIGVVYNSDKKTWEIPNSDPDIKVLNSLTDNYYPEHNLYIFRRKLSLYLLLGTNLSATSDAADMYIGVQRVTTEYLARTKNVMMPMIPYRSLYKDDAGYNRNLDTVLQSKKAFSKNETLTWDTLYPKMTMPLLLWYWKMINNDVKADADYYLWEETDFIANKEDYLRIGEKYFINADTLVFGMTSAEYLEKTAEYEQLVSDIYTRTSETERSNMERLTEEITTAYNIDNLGDKVSAAEIITAYFKNNYTYSLTTDNNAGDNTLLGNFLFETKSGHCALYATAMTLLMRELGYPARYVTGYVVYPENSYMINRYNFECTLLERNLHAWVEVYYEGLGWLPYDPTPAIASRIYADVAPAVTMADTVITSTERTELTERTTKITADETAATAETGIVPDTEEDTEAETAASIPVFVYIIIGSVLAAVLFAVSVAAFIKALGKREAKMLERYKKASARRTAAEMHDFIIKLLGAKGIKADKGELPTEFAERVTELMPDTDVDFTIVMDILEKLEFSKEELSTEDYLCISMFAISAYKRTLAVKNPLSRLFLRIKLIK